MPGMFVHLLWVLLVDLFFFVRCSCGGQILYEGGKQTHSHIDRHGGEVRWVVR